MNWISVEDRLPDRKEPIVYATVINDRKIHVGIAYWCVSEHWIPKHESHKDKAGFTHWMPLPPPPDKE